MVDNEEDNFSNSLSEQESGEDNSIMVDQHDSLPYEHINLSPVNEDSGTNGILLDSSSEFGEDEEVFRASLESAFTSKDPESKKSMETHNLSTKDFNFEPIEEFKEAEPLKLPSETRLNVVIKRLKITGEWKWSDGNDDTCGICRGRFESSCTDCKFPGDDCPMVLGVCRHPFHMHCITKWTTAQALQQRPACPLCRQEWRFA